MRPEEYGFRTIKTGNRPHKPSSPLMREIAEKFGKAHGYYGETGGWIYDAKGQHIAHGWGQFFYAVGGIRKWAVEQGLISADQEL